MFDVTCTTWWAIYVQVHTKLFEGYTSNSTTLYVEHLYLLLLWKYPILLYKKGCWRWTCYLKSYNVECWGFGPDYLGLFSNLVRWSMWSPDMVIMWALWACLHQDLRYAGQRHATRQRQVSLRPWCIQPYEVTTHILVTSHMQGHKTHPCGQPQERSQHTC